MNVTDEMVEAAVVALDDALMDAEVSYDPAIYCTAEDTRRAVLRAALEAVLGDPQPEAVVEAIGVVENSRATHVEWVEHLGAHVDCPDAEVAGSAEEHLATIAGYDKVLSVLRAVLGDPREERECDVTPECGVPADVRITTPEGDVFLCTDHARRHLGDPRDPAPSERPPCAEGLPHSVDRGKRDALAALTEGWNGHGGGVPLTDATLRIIDCLAVVPTFNGGVQIEWHANGWDVEIECAPDGSPTGWYAERVEAPAGVSVETPGADAAPGADTRTAEEPSEDEKRAIYRAERDAEVAGWMEDHWAAVDPRLAAGGTAEEERAGGERS